MAALAICFGLAAAALAPAAEPLLDLKTFMPSSEIAPGMKLIGKTCYRGTEIREFTGEVAGIEHGAFAGGNLIWAMLEGPELGPHSVAAGMSGSPCYIDGRMIGAVAYGFNGAQKPFAGITPIESMLQVLELTSAQPHPYENELNDGQATVGVWEIGELRAMAEEARPPLRSPRQVDLADLPPRAREAFPDREGLVELAPLSMPVGISRCSPEVYEPLRRRLADWNMTLAPGLVASGTVDGSALPPLEAGSALGMPMMIGDLTIGGYGTVTYREGDRLIGFGHPAYGWGNVDIPMSPCEMFALNASYVSTFKVGAVATPVGAIRQDREAAVGGVIGRVPRMIPLRVRARALETGREREFSYRLWDNRYFAPSLAATGVREAISATDRSDGDSTLRLEYAIALQGAEPIRKEVFLASSAGPAFAAGSDFRSDLSLLLNNPFRSARIESLELDLTVSARVRQTAIASVTADKEAYRPGETARLTIYLQPYRGPREKRQAEFALPSDLRDGEYRLYVGDASGREHLERDRAPGLFTPMNFDQLIEAVRLNFAGNRIYMTLVESDKGLTVHGQELPSLPTSLRATLEESSDGAFIRPVTGKFLAESVLSGDAEFIGSTQTTLIVNRNASR